MADQSFINNLYPLAMDNYKKYGILPSLTIGQAILESNSGKSTLASQSNNLFGIKGVGTAGSIEMQTTEEENGKNVSVLAFFRKYFSITESVDDYGKLLNGSRYTNVKNAPNYKTGAYALYSAGYATDSQYPTKLINVIESNNLGGLDTIAKSGGTISAPSTSGSSGSSSIVQPLPNNSGSPSTTKTGILDALNPANWMDFIKEILLKMAFFIPALILLALGIYLLFSDQINTAVKAYATGGVSLAGDLSKGEE